VPATPATPATPVVPVTPAVAKVAQQGTDGLTGPSPDKMTFSAKKRFFEKEITDAPLPTAKPEKRFSYLSEDEIKKLHQEEERKIASMTSEQLLNLSRLDDVDEEDEDEVQAAEMEPVAVAITVSTVPTAQHPAIVRTAKAEKRLKDRLQREGLELSEEEKKLSPNEQRALQAKKRAAWREARLKSLEQDAMQAEMVIKKMSEFNLAADSSSGSLSSTMNNTSPSANNNNNANNNQSEPDFANNNEVEMQSTDEDRIDEEDEAEGDSADQASQETTENAGEATGLNRRKKKSKKNKNR